MQVTLVAGLSFVQPDKVIERFEQLQEHSTILKTATTGDRYVMRLPIFAHKLWNMYAWTEAQINADLKEPVRNG